MIVPMRLSSMFLLAAGLAMAPACAEAGPPPGEGAVQRQMPRLSAPDTLAMCLHRHQDPAARETCIGEYAEACMRLSGEGGTTAGMVRCTGEEAAAWDDALNTAYTALHDSLNASQAAALREAQRAWIALRDTDCSYLASYFEGGSMAQIEHANCVLHKTAERTIELQRWQADYPPL